MHRNLEDDVENLLAGKELSSSTKTYINTLITLYNGFGVDPTLAVDMLRGKMYEYERWGQETAGLIYELIIAKNYKGSYIIGNEPNIELRNGSICSGV